MPLLDRIPGGFEGKEALLLRAGRIAGVSFIIAGLLAIPAYGVAEDSGGVAVWPSLIGIVPGIVCLVLPWERLPLSSIHVVAVVGTVIVATVAVVGDPVYDAFYIFVALFVTRIFLRPRPIAAHLGLICVGLLLPVLVGSNTGEPALVAALLAVPAVILLPAFFGSLATELDSAEESYRALSRQDELTGVGNYRALHERLEEEISRHGRRQRRFALLLVDLNGFKEVNELHGHLEGDRVLAEVGAALEEGVRTEDSVFRQGGDEFSVIAPETGPESAEELGARLRIRLAGLSGVDPPLSACTGVAIFPDDGDNWSDLIGFADVRLLAAKREYYAARSEPGLHEARRRGRGERG